MIGIYKIVSPNGKVYIGQSVDIINRKKYYKNTKNCINQTRLYRSIIKYGWENHSFDIVEDCEIDQLNEKERYWQDFYDSVNKGLNCRLTKSTDKSGHLSQETKDRIAFSNTGKIKSIETREKIAVIHRGSKHTIEHNAKVSLNSSRWNAGLSDKDVHIICKMYLSGKTTREVKVIYPETHYCTLSEIRNKKRYKHISNLYNIGKPSKKGIKWKIKKIVLCIEDGVCFEGIYNAGKSYGISYKTVSNSALKNKTIKKINKTFKYIVH